VLLAGLLTPGDIGAAFARMAAAMRRGVSSFLPSFFWRGHDSADPSILFSPSMSSLLFGGVWGIWGCTISLFISPLFRRVPREKQKAQWRMVPRL
jgi:hypothetical protein